MSSRKAYYTSLLLSYEYNLTPAEPVRTEEYWITDDIIVCRLASHEMPCNVLVKFDYTQLD